MAKAIKSDFKILHTADWHICNDFIGDATRCIEFMVNNTTSSEVDLIAVPGDIYNHRQIQQETGAARFAMFAVKQLADLAPVVILTGTPSHDGKAPMMLNHVGGFYPILVVDRPGSWVLYERDLARVKLPEFYFYPMDSGFIQPPDIARAVISFTPAFTKQYFDSGSDVAQSNDEIARALSGVFSQLGLNYSEYVKATDAPVPHILLGHYSIGGAFIHPSQPMTGRDIEISRDQLALSNASINLLGHIHAAQQVNENTFYSGSLFATDFGEFEEKGYYIHKLLPTDFGHTWDVRKSEFIPTPSPTLVKLECDLIKSNIPDDLILQAVIMKADEVPEVDGELVIRLEVRIYQDKAEFIDEKAIYEYFEEMKPRSFKLSIVRLPRPNVRSAKILAADRLSDKLLAYADILGGEISDSTLAKADVLQDNAPDQILNTITKSFRGETENNEIAKS